MERAWEAGVKFVEQVVRVPVPAPFDVVVTSGAGYPLDTTWYQAIKGLTGALRSSSRAAHRAGRQPERRTRQPRFQQIMTDNPDLKEFKKRILGQDYFVMDQWQLEELAKVVERCKVKVVSDGISPEALRRCYVEPAATVEQAVADSLREYGPAARVAVIPKGPYVLPYVGT